MLITSCLKVATFLGMWVVIWLPIAFFVSRLIDWQPNQPLIPKQKIILLLSLYLLTPIVMGWKFRVENFSFADLGLDSDSNIFTSILLGLIISLAGLAVTFLIESFFNLVSWHRKNIRNLLPLLLPVLVLSLLISLTEELVFRGYTFSTLAASGTYWLAAIISSTIFALLHLVWERRVTIPQVPGLWLMGMILVESRLISGDLYLAIGLHAGWIWGLTCIDSAQLLSYRHKDNWFTGIYQQPLAGIAGISCLTITGLALWLINSKFLLS
jgi:uncharacterized protein